MRLMEALQSILDEEEWNALDAKETRVSFSR